MTKPLATKLVETNTVRTNDVITEIVRTKKILNTKVCGSMCRLLLRALRRQYASVLTITAMVRVYLQINANSHI